MFKIRSLFTIAAIATLVFNAAAFAVPAAKKRHATFKVRIENISSTDGIAAADGSKYPFAVSPGFYAVTESKFDLFTVGKKAPPGLEAQAEDGDPEMLSDAVTMKGLAGSYGAFLKPVGANMPAPILPGGAYEFTFMATEGTKLSVVAMYGQSNDLFYAPAKAIALFNESGAPLTGDITADFQLWDAGTEVNQAPGIGADQAPRQKMKNAGAAENGVVGPVKDGFTYPVTKDVLRITITAN